MFVGLPKELIADEEEPPVPAAGGAAGGEGGEKGSEKPESKRSKKRKMAAAAAAAKKVDPLGVRKLKLDQNAPEYKRIPLTPLSVSDKLDRVAAQKEYKKAAKVSPGSLPSICFYTALNSDSMISSMAISNDSSMMACGLSVGSIKVWSLLNTRPLRTAKNHHDLAKLAAENPEDLLDLESVGGANGDLMLSDELMSSQSASDSKTLVGHQGPVLDMDFTPSRHWLISAGQDGDIRLWSLLLWQCLTIYRGHLTPVTSVRFSAPPSLYFVSGGFDKTVRVWSTEWSQSLRICIGHNEDVSCVAFHPNCNYVASGSCDRTVRIWDLENGSCVRMFTAHKDAVQCVQFSPCGQLLASGDQSGTVCLFKLGVTSASLCATLPVSSSSPESAIANSDAAIYSITFSRDSNALAVGSGGCFVSLFLIERNPTSQSQATDGKQQQQLQQQSAALAASLSSNAACAPVRLEPLTTARTKQTPVLLVHFTRRNLLLAAGPIDR